METAASSDHRLLMCSSNELDDSLAISIGNREVSEMDFFADENRTKEKSMADVKKEINTHDGMVVRRNELEINVSKPCTHNFFINFFFKK